MGWFSGLFGGSETALKTLDIVDSSLSGIGAWIDEKDFTPEEKSKALAVAVKDHLELVKSTVNENSGRSVTRRWLACGIVTWVLLHTTAAIILAVTGFKDQADMVFTAIVSVGGNMLLLAIVGFYFGVQFLRK